MHTKTITLSLYMLLLLSCGNDEVYKNHNVWEFNDRGCNESDEFTICIKTGNEIVDYDYEREVNLCDRSSVIFKYYIKISDDFSGDYIALRFDSSLIYAFKYIPSVSFMENVEDFEGNFSQKINRVWDIKSSNGSWKVFFKDQRTLGVVFFKKECADIFDSTPIFNVYSFNEIDFLIKTKRLSLEAEAVNPPSTQNAFVERVYVYYVE